MTEPIIVPGMQMRADLNRSAQPIAVTGQSFDVHEWSGSGPDYLHIHYADDEAWHILEGRLTFRFIDKQVDAPAGTTLRDLISALHGTPREQHNAIMHKFESEILA